MRIILLPALFLMFCFCANAQLVDSTSKKTNVVEFGKADRAVDNTVYDGQAIKLGILDMISGLYGIHYERELGDALSLQVGGGATGKNFCREFTEEFYNGEGSQTSNNFDESHDYYDGKEWDYRKATMGYFFEIHPKYYFEEIGFDGLYLGLNFQHRKYKFEANTTVDATSGYVDVTYSDNMMDEFETQNIYAVTWGNQWVKKTNVVDYNIAIGLRQVSGERRDVGYVDQPMGNRYYTTLTDTYSQSNFFLAISLKFGFWWGTVK